MTSKESKNEREKISTFNLLSYSKKANSTLEKQKQANDLWKIVKNDQSLYEKKVKKLTHFSPVSHFYTPLKTSENERFSDVFRGYRNVALD